MFFTERGTVVEKGSLFRHTISSDICNRQCCVAPTTEQVLFVHHYISTMHELGHTRRRSNVVSDAGAPNATDVEEIRRRRSSPKSHERSEDRSTQRKVLSEGPFDARSRAGTDQLRPVGGRSDPGVGVIAQGIINATEVSVGRTYVLWGMICSSFAYLVIFFRLSTTTTTTGVVPGFACPGWT